MRRHAPPPTSRLDPFVAADGSIDPAALLAASGTARDGLAPAEAAARRLRFGPNTLGVTGGRSRLTVLRNQVKSPLLLLLIFAAMVSAATGEWVDASIVSSIVLATVLLGYVREFSAETAVMALRSRVQARVVAVRGGHEQTISVEEVVPGDIVLLSAGCLVPADAVVLEASAFYVSEAILTGESFPVQKSPQTVPGDAPLAKRSNCVFLGTNVRSGTARCLVVATGQNTVFGAIAERLEMGRPEAEFDRGLRRFGYLMTIAMLVLVVVVFVIHVLQGRPIVETLLFAIALAVGLSPELLPAILSVNLSRGANEMARHGVLVRRLPAIENLGSMDVLCTDKTGTLTEGVIALFGAFDPLGASSPAVLHTASLNAALETGLPSPLDDAILAAHTPALETLVKHAEVPFDFVRKRVSIVVSEPEHPAPRLITKGAFHHVLEICTSLPDGSPLDDRARAELEARYDAWSRQGIRVLAVAARLVPDRPSYTREDETDLVFVGFLAFVDRPKPGVRAALQSLRDLHVTVKLITGDSRQVACHVAEEVGLATHRVLSGADLLNLPDEALWRVAEQTDLFVEVDPNQKERIIRALKKTGHVVGFLGDGVNDAAAMHVADTSLCVDHATDVAREAADFVLLESDLEVIRRGIEEGRKTFANTLKYVLTTTSANLGNMMSMAVASLFLPFLPLLAGQILLNNFLSDIPAVGLADDSVDEELVTTPGRWDMRFIGRFMVEFGALSSAFDLLTFALLLTVFHATPEVFHTGWFVLSLLTELVIALVVRTRRFSLRSRPGRLLGWSTAALVALAIGFPYLPYVGVLGFTTLPPELLVSLVALTLVYAGAAELLKRGFYRRTRPSPA